MKVNPTYLMVAAGLGALIPTTSKAANSKDQKRPNVLIMLADDMGYDDLSLRGNPCVSTPILDSLAQISTRFENFYVHSVSAPTRASLLTGRHFLRTGVTGVHGGRDFMNLDEVTIAEAFRDAGYTTGMWGKWHSGKTAGYYPWQRGFDEAYMAKLYVHHDNVGLLNGDVHATEGWTDAVLADMAIDFMKRNKDNEFFAYLPFLSPHGGWDAPEEDVQRKMAEGQSKKFATLNSMIENLDTQVGRVLQAMDEEGLLENTIVVFLSDNGPIGAKDMSEEEWIMRNPSEQRGNKGTNYENGIHSELFIYWKGHYQSAVNNSLLAVYDLFPTLCDITDVDIPDNAKEMDGISFKKILEDPSKTNKNRSIVVSQWHPYFDDFEPDVEPDRKSQYRPLSASVRENLKPEIQRIGIHRNDDKTLFNHDGGDSLALWNLSVDAKERVNLYNEGTAKDRKKTLKYRKEVMKWYSDMLAEGTSHQMPTFQLGYGDKPHTNVYCYAPYNVSDGLKNYDHYLMGFDTKGEYGEYKINVLKEGDYEFTMTVNKEFKGKAKFRMYTNTAKDCGIIELDGQSSNTVRLNLTKDVNILGIEMIETTESLDAISLNVTIL